MAEKGKERVPFWMKEVEDIKDSIKDVIIFDSSSKPEPPKFIFFVNDAFLFGGKNLKGLITQNCLMLIDGKTKSMKTTSVKMMIASHLSSRGIYENIHCTMDPNQHVMVFDTEQSQEEFDNNIANIIKISGNEKKPDNLHAYNLKFLMSPEKKINYIIYAVEQLLKKYTRGNKIKKEDKIGMIVIDHAGDLLYDINSKEETGDVIQFLTFLIKITGALLVVIMHQNKNNTEPTGAIGYELQKKATIYCSASKDKDKDDPDDPSRFKLVGKRIPANFKSFLINYKGDYPTTVKS